MMKFAAIGDFITYDDLLYRIRYLINTTPPASNLPPPDIDSERRTITAQVLAVMQNGTDNAECPIKYVVLANDGRTQFIRADRVFLVDRRS